MAPKLAEMDEVVKMIHTSILTRENDQGWTLLVSASTLSLLFIANEVYVSYTYNIESLSFWEQAKY